jgi:hypothetical protein
VYYRSADSTTYDYVYAVSRTQLTSFKLPAKVEAHHTWYASGTAQRWNGSIWETLRYAGVQLYYRPKGSTYWYKDTRAYTDATGHFSTLTNVHLGTADWQARVVKDTDVLPSTSATVTSTVTDQTRFYAVSAYRSSGNRSQVSGWVYDWYNGQHRYTQVKGVTLRLYYRRAGSSTWHYLTHTVTYKNGWFMFGHLWKGHGYYFRVVLPAQSFFLGSTSRTV